MKNLIPAYMWFSSFTNELGNVIFMDIAKTDEEVQITLVGPSSTSTNLITLMEAKKLNEGLTDVLSR